MFIRQGEIQDVHTLADLIFDSAPSLLSAAFDIDTEHCALNFIKASLLNPEGQYGHKNHWVMVKNEQVVGCISAWHSELPEHFHLATLSAITDFYGFENALTVLHNNQMLQDCLTEIEQAELCVGHLVVRHDYQRQGVATVLLEYMQQQARQRNKSLMSLDVEAGNQRAIDFYFAQGFRQISESIVTPRMIELGIGQHLHLTKVL